MRKVRQGMFPEGRDYFLCTLDKNLGSGILSWDIKIKNISIQKMIFFAKKGDSSYFSRKSRIVTKLKTLVNHHWNLK